MNRLFTLASALILTWTINAQNGLDFDGVDDYVQTSFNGVLGSNNRTFEAWVFLSNAPSSNQCIIDYGTNAVGSRNTFSIGPNLELRFISGGTNANISSSSGAVSINQWTHVAFVLDNGTGYLYSNGVQVGSGNLTTVNTPSGNTNVRLGERVSGGSIPLNGVIDEVRIWNTARTASEIANASNNEFCSNPTGLVAYYKLNEGIAAGTNTGVTTAADLAMGNDGTLNNFALSGTTSNWVTGYALATGNVQDSLSATECFSYTSPSGETYTSSGIYTDTIPTAFGCDSILTIDLTINSIDTTLQVNNQTITAVHNGTNYQWLDCENNYAPIAGQTGQSITVSNNGSYAVQIVSNGCLDTTECATIGGIGLQEPKTQTLHLFPNPTRDQLWVKGWEGAFSYAVHDLSGRMVLRGTGDSESFIDVKFLSPGTYYIHIQNDEDEGFMKFIVQ